MVSGSEVMVGADVKMHPCGIRGAVARARKCALERRAEVQRQVQLRAGGRRDIRIVENVSGHPRVSEARQPEALHGGNPVSVVPGGEFLRRHETRELIRVDTQVVQRGAQPIVGQAALRVEGLEFGREV